MVRRRRRVVLPLLQLRLGQLHWHIPDLLPEQSAERLSAQYGGMDHLCGGLSPPLLAFMSDIRES